MNNKLLTSFYIVRHGEADWNVKGLLQGHSESPLTKKGRDQAKILGNKLKDMNFDLAFSSDLFRAKKTAEIIALEHQLAVETTELLRERNFGKYEGKPYEAIRTYDELLRNLNKEERHIFSQDGVENEASFIGRVFTFLRETAITHPGKKILVVSHGGVMRSLLMHLGVAKETVNHSSVSIKNAAYIKLLSDGSDFYVNELEGVTITEEK